MHIAVHNTAIMVMMLAFFALITGIVISCFTACYLLALCLRDTSIVDVIWGLGFIVIAVFSVGVKGGSPVLIVMTALVIVWGLRLALHIFLRKRKHKGEDFRYAQWREDWGKTFLWRSYLQVFLLQALIMLVIALPIIGVAHAGENAISAMTIAGSIVWFIGFGFESTADAQLTRFKRYMGNKGKIITTGLWRYSRHPNYFGEAVQWWGLWLIALSVPGTWWTVISPVTITLLLRFVSGVPMLERKYAGREDFDEYKRRTNAFVPWLPHEGKAGLPLSSSPGSPGRE